MGAVNHLLKQNDDIAVARDLDSSSAERLADFAFMRAQIENVRERVDLGSPFKDLELGATRIVRERLADIAKSRTLLAVEEVAELLGVPRSTAYDACKRGQIPTVLLGRRVLVSVAVLEKILLSGNGSK